MIKILFLFERLYNWTRCCNFKRWWGRTISSRSEAFLWTRCENSLISVWIASKFSHDSDGDSHAALLALHLDHGEIHQQGTVILLKIHELFFFSLCFFREAGWNESPDHLHGISGEQQHRSYLSIFEPVRNTNSSRNEIDWYANIFRACIFAYAPNNSADIGAVMDLIRSSFLYNKAQVRITFSILSLLLRVYAYSIIIVSLSDSRVCERGGSRCGLHRSPNAHPSRYANDDEEKKTTNKKKERESEPKRKW